jgi:4-alpha-glucanotransferase
MSSNSVAYNCTHNLTSIKGNIHMENEEIEHRAMNQRKTKANKLTEPAKERRSLRRIMAEHPSPAEATTIGKGDLEKD